MNRREFSALAAAGLAAGGLGSNALFAEVPAKSSIKAIAFDAFPVFDPRPVFVLAEQLFPGKGVELSDAWRTRQFEYTWLRICAKQYADFWQVTQDALAFAAHKVGVELVQEKRDALMQAYLRLKTWPDVLPALGALKKAGLRLVFLSNFTPNMLEECIQSSGLGGMFEHVLSSDQAKTYKPDPRAYQLGIDALKLKREEILFAAFAGWDAAGAQLFGYPTFWVNRMKQPKEEFGREPVGVGETLSDLVKYLG